MNQSPYKHLFIIVVLIHSVAFFKFLNRLSIHSFDKNIDFYIFICLTRRVPVMLKDLLSLIFPNVCIGCNSLLVKGESYLCTSCRTNLPILSFNQYETEIFHRNLINSHQYRFAYSFLKFYKSGITQKILHELKYNNQPLIGELMGQLAANELMNNLPKSVFDLIIPIPLHPTKRSKRGYNQSDYFAKGLAGAMGIEWNGSLVYRIRNNATQTRKTRIERQDNVKDVFSVNSPILLEGKSVLLVDDVATTGATLDACSSMLLKCNVTSISICTIAAAQ